MWHWPQVSGSRARATDAEWRAWQLVQVPIEPSGLGRPTLWQFMQPVRMALGPSRMARALAGRSTAPLWYFSAAAICSGLKSFGPVTAAQAGAAWRLRT